jgi:hypothetical protein
MFLKRWCYLLIFCFLANTIFAQKVTVNWSDKIKSASGITNGGTFLKSIGGSNEAVVAVFGTRAKRGFSFGDLSPFPNIKLIKLNKQLEVQKELDFEFPANSKRGYLDFVKLNGHYYLISFSIDRSAMTMDIYYQLINETDLTLSGTSTQLVNFSLADYDKSNRIQSSDLQVDYSPDSSKLLFVYEPDLRKKDNKEIVLAVADETMKVLVKGKHSFNELYKKVRLNNSSVDDDGKVYLSYNLYEKDFDRDYIKNDGDKIPGFTTNICILSGSEKNIYSFASQGKFLHQSSIAYSGENTICIVGLYKDKHNGRITGAFKANIDEARKVIGSTVIFTPFPQEILDKVDIDKFGNNGAKKPGLDNDFSIRYTLSSLPSGTIRIITEFHETFTSSIGQSATVNEVWGDVVIATFNPNASNAEYALISKKQTQTVMAVHYDERLFTGYKSVGCSFEPIFYKNKLLLFYNDDEDNIGRDPGKKPEPMTNTKKSMLMMAEIPNKGNLVKATGILSHRDYDGYMTKMDFNSLKENTYSVFAVNIGLFKYGVKVGILTIK